MGDGGARLLAKALQINTRLRIINLDRNGISLQGYTDITYALQSNYAMRHIPFPTFDIQPYIKTHPERVDAVMHRLQDLLQRNSSPHRFRNTAQAFRLTQGFLLSSTQQVLDRVSASAQDNIDAMKKVRPETDEDEIKPVKELIQEADNSKHLLSALHETAAKRADEVDKKLKDVSEDMTAFVSKHITDNLNEMLACAENQCPRVLNRKDGKVASDVKSACGQKCQLSPDFISTLITDQVGLEIHNKINELNLIIANHISDRVIEQVIEAVSEESKNLSSDITLKKKRSLTPDVLKPSKSDKDEHETLSITTASSDIASQKSESSPISTPQTNKRVMTARRLRPKSVVDDSSHLNGGGSLEELPSSSPLQHLGKARPKRAKKHAPSRGAIVHRAQDQEDFNDKSPSILEAPIPRVGSVSSTGVLSQVLKNARSRNASREDVSSERDQHSPMPPKAKSGLSCLASATTDEESPPPPSATKSPEKKGSVQSISDIFGGKATSSSKLNKEDASSPKLGVSPVSKKPMEPHSPAMETFTDEKPAESKTPEEVVKRHGVGHGGNLDLMAEIREKRASMVPKAPTDEDLSPKTEHVKEKSVFSAVKLR